MPAGTGTFLAVLAVLMAIAAVAIALTASSGGGSGLDPIDSDSVDQQVDDLKQFLRDNTR